MIGEKLIKIIVNDEGKPEDWPENEEEWSKVYFITDKGIYKYTLDAFIKQDTVPNGESVQGIEQAINKTNVNTKKDDEFGGMLVFENGDVLEFDYEVIVHSPDLYWGRVYTYRNASDIDWDHEYYRDLKPLVIK